MATEAHTKNEKENLGLLNIKRESPIPLQELDSNTLELKRSKKSEQTYKVQRKKNNTDGGVAAIAE